MKFKPMQKRGLLAFFTVAPWAIAGQSLFFLGLAFFFLLLPFILDDEPLGSRAPLTNREILGFLLYISGTVFFVWNLYNGTLDPNSSVSLLYITPIVIGFFLLIRS